MVGVESRLLAPVEERRLLKELARCREQMTTVLARLPVEHRPPSPAGEARVPGGTGAADDRQRRRLEVRLCVLHARYQDRRGRLALANVRLVAHVAKRFRDRGVAYSDLLQEGFCGLLEAIDRFDLSRETKLSTYATWWIRQAMQRAVAAGAYPVRLSPRHLRHLSRNQSMFGPAGGRADQTTPELVRRIHAATRPTVSLDATLRDGRFNRLQTMSDRGEDQAKELDAGDAIGHMMEALAPRERNVIALRFGLGGRPSLSLSQVGEVLEVSKERVRQIQVRALAKLRSLAEEQGLPAPLAAGL
jgi:RNA polymerase primary sigma factor